MRGKKPRSDSMPPVFGLPPAIQKMSLKQASAWAAEVGIGGFGIVDVEDSAAAAELFHAVGEARERAQPGLNRRRFEAERQRRGGGAGGVLRIVQSAQRADAAELGDRRNASGPWRA